MKGRRQSAILELVSGRPVRSQDALRRLLAAMGIQATQATISRDVKELGLVKRSADGALPVGPGDRRRRRRSLTSGSAGRWPSTCGTSNGCSSFSC